jgi:hypothetical protein
MLYGSSTALVLSQFVSRLIQVNDFMTHCWMRRMKFVLNRSMGPIWNTNQDFDFLDTITAEGPHPFAQVGVTILSNSLPALGIANPPIRRKIITKAPLH